MSLADRIIEKYLRRTPDLQIGGSANPYMNRWYIIPRNPVFNIYLHQFMRDDEDRALHDHPWFSLSIMLRGKFSEIMHDFVRGVRAGDFVFRSPWHAHRLVVQPDQRGNTWTIFITGPRMRQWGFHCPGKWVHWREFTEGPNGEIVGKGCGE